jgi:hypothetical protein
VDEAGLRDLIARTRTSEVVVLTATAETPWRAMLPLLEASRGRLASTGFALAVRGEPQRRTAPVRGAGSPGIRPMTPATGSADGGTEDDAQPWMRVELKNEGPTLVDNEALRGPLGARVRAAKERGVAVAVLMTSDDGLPLGAVVDATREVQAGGIAVAYAFRASP